MSTIFEKDGRRILFVHIPKCSGTSVRMMLQEEGWKPQPQHIIRPTFFITGEFAGPVTSNHQHAEMRNDWISKWDYEFALVRNPYDRLVSRGKQSARRLKLTYIKEVNFFAWADDVLGRVMRKEGPGAEDNHYRPQVEFISDKTQWFRMEDQKELFLETLRKENIISNTAKLGVFNKSLSENNEYSFNWGMFPDIHKRFLDKYKKDFDVFGYKI